MVKTLRRILKWSAVAFSLVLVLAALALLVAYWRSDNDCAERAARVPNEPMKAIVYCEFGSPDVLRLEEIERPVPEGDQVLVRVHAASVNPLDSHYMRGTPYLMRMGAGLRKPKVTRLGVDFAGTVEAVGGKVTELKPGDEVFGGRTGAFAEYVAVRADRLVTKPGNLTFEQAAAVQVAGLTALQALRDRGKVQPGQRVLINGASGGVGTFAVQIAKTMGAHVTGVCSTRNVDLVRSLGADDVVDYTRHDFTSSAQRYDVIVDMVGNHPLSAYRRVMKPNGIYVLVGAPKGRWIAPVDRFVKASLYSRFVSQEFVPFISESSRDDLLVLRDLMQKGNVTPVIDRTYPLDQLPEAIRYMETGRARGKVVVVVSE
jgi:NADPH:quinone reductase-like Zn-dependent oxidoreductase